MSESHEKDFFEPESADAVTDVSDRVRIDCIVKGIPSVDVYVRYDASQGLAFFEIILLPGSTFDPIIDHVFLLKCQNDLSIPLQTLQETITLETKGESLVLRGQARDPSKIEKSSQAKIFYPFHVDSSLPVSCLKDVDEKCFQGLKEEYIRLTSYIVENNLDTKEELALIREFIGIYFCENADLFDQFLEFLVYERLMNNQEALEIVLKVKNSSVRREAETFFEDSNNFFNKFSAEYWRKNVWNTLAKVNDTPSRFFSFNYAYQRVLSQAIDYWGEKLEIHFSMVKKQWIEGKSCLIVSDELKEKLIQLVEKLFEIGFTRDDLWR